MWQGNLDNTHLSQDLYLWEVDFVFISTCVEQTNRLYNYFLIFGILLGIGFVVLIIRDWCHGATIKPETH
uniref:FXYD domain-containing ion transport regulator n=1 Tax=Schistosoma curassoni TaxID=6186 RepID=A0A183L5G5_9TREM